MGGFAEVPLEYHGEARVVLVDGASERKRATENTDAAGGASLRTGIQGDPRRGILTWSITGDDGAAIRVAETWIAERANHHETDETTSAAPLPRSHVVRVVFPNALRPMACVLERTDEPDVAAVVAVVDVAGVARRVAVPSFAAAARRRAGLNPKAGALAGDAALTALTSHDVTSHDVSGALAPLEGPTAMCAVGTKLVAVGGASGRVALFESSAASFEPVAELRPATLARLWNAMAGPAAGAGGASRLAVRGLRMVPRETGDAPALLATVREDCHLQVWDVTTPARPTSVMGAALPASAAAVFGGVAADGGDARGGGARAASAAHVADGFLALATRAADSAEPARGDETTIAVYRLDVGGPQGSAAGPTVAFHASVDVPGAVAAVSLCDGALLSLSAGGVVSGWSLDDLAARTSAATTPDGVFSQQKEPAAFGLDDAADALAAWDTCDPALGSGAAFALLGCHAEGDAPSGARAVDVAADLTNEIAARGAADAAALRDALATLRWPRAGAAEGRGGVLAAATAAVLRAAGGPDAPAAAAVAAWAALAPAYAAAWRARNAPLGLVAADAGGGDAAIVVRRGSVGVARPLGDVEAFIARACIEGGSGSESPAAQALALGAALDARLGAPASRALDLAASGFGSAKDDDAEARGALADAAAEARAGGAAEDWLDAAAACAFGRVAPAPGGGVDDVARAALAARRAEQRRAAAATRAAVARLREAGATPASAAAAALDAIEWRAEDTEYARGGGTRWTPHAEAQSARTHADARARATRAVLLVLGAARRMGARVGVSAADAAAAAAAIPRAVAAHRAALLARWLVSTPCAGAVAAAAAPGAPPPLAAAVASWTAGAGEGPGPGPPAAGGPAAALAGVGRARAASLALGGGVTRRIRDGSQSDLSAYEGAYARAVEIGSELYAVGELDALGALVAAARAASPGDPLDPAPEAPALSFLRALRASAALRLESDEGPERAGSAARAAARERALGFFFRAASGVPGAPGETRGGDADGSRAFKAAGTAAGDPLLGHLVELLRSIMSGFPAASARADADADAMDTAGAADAGPAAGPGPAAAATVPALTRLEYYETLMLFFERLGAADAAAACAHAALREVSAAFPEDELDDEDAETHLERTSGDDDDMTRGNDDDVAPSALSRHRRASRLWANLLQYALDLGRWRDAYAATLSVPGAESRRAALRRLVAAACEPGALSRGGGAALASLPLSGDRLDAVARALETRATASTEAESLSVSRGPGPDAFESLESRSQNGTGPSPGRVLYALRVARGEMREAARAARDEATRLERVVASAAAAARRARAAFADASAAAEDAGPSGSLERAAVAATTALALALERQAGALLAALNALRLCAPGERGVWDDDRDPLGDTKSQSHDETVGAVARAAILASARLELLVAGAEPAETRLGEHLGNLETPTSDAYAIVPSLVASLVSHARFASAETLACAWTEGEALTDLACLIAAALAARAALAQQADRRLARDDDDADEAFDSSFGSSPFVALESLGALGRSCASPDARACGGGILGASLGGERREEEADAAQAWAATRAFLERHDVARRNFRPAEAAARAVLATGTQIRLPQWLVARFVRGRNEGETKGMAARDANPAALLRVYLAHNRLEEAARLAVAEVAAARRAPATERTRSCASWFPEPLLRHTRERVREVHALESLGEELERLLEQRSRTAEADSAKLAAAA